MWICYIDETKAWQLLCFSLQYQFKWTQFISLQLSFISLNHPNQGTMVLFEEANVLGLMLTSRNGEVSPAQDIGKKELQSFFVNKCTRRAGRDREFWAESAASPSNGSNGPEQAKGAERMMKNVVTLFSAWAITSPQENTELFEDGKELDVRPPAIPLPSSRLWKKLHGGCLQVILFSFATQSVVCSSAVLVAPQSLL